MRAEFEKAIPGWETPKQHLASLKSMQARLAPLPSSKEGKKLRASIAAKIRWMERTFMRKKKAR